MTATILVQTKESCDANFCEKSLNDCRGTGWRSTRWSKGRKYKAYKFRFIYLSLFQTLCLCLLLNFSTRETTFLLADEVADLCHKTPCLTGENLFIWPSWCRWRWRDSFGWIIGRGKAKECGRESKTLAAEGGWVHDDSCFETNKKTKMIPEWKCRGYSSYWMLDGSFIVIQRVHGVRNHPVFGVPRNFSNVYILVL